MMSNNENALIRHYIQLTRGMLGDMDIKLYQENVPFDDLEHLAANASSIITTIRQLLSMINLLGITKP